MWKSAVVILLLTACVFAEAGRKGKGKGKWRAKGNKGAGKKMPPGAVVVGVWNRTLKSETAKEVGFTIPGAEQQIFVLSGNKRQLKKDGFKKSKTVFDFTGGKSKVVLRLKKMCFMLPRGENLTRESVLEEIASYNDQTRDATAPVPLQATMLDADQLAELTSRPTIATLCGPNPLRYRALTPKPEVPAVGKSKTFLTTTLDEQLSITITKGGKMKKNKKGKGKGRRGRKGKGKGRGRKNKM